MKLLVSLLSGLLSLTVMGDLAAPFPLESHALLSPGKVEYRQYKDGDNLALVTSELNPIDCEIYHCWVGVSVETKVRLF